MNNRHFRRIPFEAEVTLRSGPDAWSGELLDVAMKGAMVGTGSPLPASLGAEYSLCISLNGTPSLSSFKRSWYTAKRIAMDLNLSVRIWKP